MCRICGSFNTNATDRETMYRVAGHLHHGGPDACYVEGGNGYALANTRLAVVDLDGGEQPYRLGTQIKIIFNGEIYNHVELREELVAKGYRFPDRCDGSILPALYAEHGLAFADRLQGMYAIAIVDLREEARLVLVTDEVGMKPLHYAWDAASGVLHFASEIEALLAFPDVDSSPRVLDLDDYLATKAKFGEQTMFEGIRTLPPAATAVVDRRDGLRVHVRDVAAGPAVAAGTDLDPVARRLRSLLVREVRRMLAADVPVAAITSGGLDSSLVTVLAALETVELDTFNLAYVGRWPHDERAFAAEVAAHAGTTHHQVELDPMRIHELLPQVVRSLGQPNADPITVSTYALFEQVHAAGFKVAVTGDAADELFGGYDRIKAAVGATGDWIGPYVEALAAIPRPMRDALYSSDYRAHLEGRTRTDDRLRDQLAQDRGPRLDAITSLEVTERLPAYHLQRVDALSMAWAVEARLPFCQPEVVRFARSLPVDLRVQGDKVKRALYRAARGLVPDSVLEREKQPFTLPIAAMLQPGQPLYAFAAEVLSGENLRAHGLLDARAVQELLGRQAVTPSNATALAVWSLMTFELWLAGARTPVPARVSTRIPGVAA